MAHDSDPERPADDDPDAEPDGETSEAPVERRVDDADESGSRPDDGRSGSDSSAERRPPMPPVGTSRHTDEPHVSVTIEGDYETVMDRLEHPQALQHSELEQIMDNVESTLMAVVATGGGIRSEIYDAVDFELDDPWEIRKYLEVLAMHDLIHLRDDQWVPSDYFERDDGSP